MGSHCKKAIIAESVRDSLHSWCKRVKARSKATNSITTRSTCSLESIIDEGDEIITIGSPTLSPCSSFHDDDQECDLESSRMQEGPSESPDDVAQDKVEEEEVKIETLLELLQKT